MGRGSTRFGGLATLPSTILGRIRITFKVLSPFLSRGMMPRKLERRRRSRKRSKTQKKINLYPLRRISVGRHLQCCQIE